MGKGVTGAGPSYIHTAHSLRLNIHPAWLLVHTRNAWAGILISVRALAFLVFVMFMPRVRDRRARQKGVKVQLAIGVLVIIILVLVILYLL